MAKAHRNTPERRQMLTNRRITQEVRGASLQMNREKKIIDGINGLKTAETDEDKAKFVSMINEGLSLAGEFTPVPAKPRLSVRGLRGRPWLTKKNNEHRLNSKADWEREQELKRQRDKLAKENAAKNFVYETTATV